MCYTQRNGRSDTTRTGAVEHSHTSDNGVDLFCLRCRYNLRGLAGDAVRCPECGYENDAEDLRIPHEEISRQLRKLETAPTISVAAVWVLVLAGIIVWVGGACVGVALAVSALLGCACSAAVFGRACRFRDGWVRILCWYHLAGITYLALVGMAVGVMSWAYRLWGGTGGFIVLTAIIVTRLLAHLLAYFGWVSPPRGVYALAKEKLDAFCHEVAVERFHRRGR